MPVLVVGAALAASGCGCGAAASPHPTTSAQGTGTAIAPARVAARARKVAVRPIDPGRLPQTDAEPGFGRALTAQLATLWAAIAADSTRIGRAAFFPEAAYRQLKAIPDPLGDYTYRLLALYDLDIGAYHASLGRRPESARLVEVEADPGLAEWIPAGACENSIGYWHLPGTRLVYVAGARRASVGVFSLISWRGVWYVIHLGPNPRPVSVGTLDDPQRGPGVPGPGGGC